MQLLGWDALRRGIYSQPSIIGYCGIYGRQWMIEYSTFFITPTRLDGKYKINGFPLDEMLG